MEPVTFRMKSPTLVAKVKKFDSFNLLKAGYRGIGRCRMAHRLNTNNVIKPQVVQRTNTVFYFQASFNSFTKKVPTLVPSISEGSSHIRNTFDTPEVACYC